MPSSFQWLTFPASVRMRTGLALFSLLALILTAGIPAQARAGESAPRPAGEAARIVTVRDIDTRTQDVQVYSPAMRTTIPVRIILPKSWKSKRNARFPVMYLLHGGDDDYTSWTRETDVEDLARRSEALIVMPDGGRNGYYSDWFTGKPRWETFHIRELVPLVERAYRGSSSRAIIGLSMGGFGALIYAGRHPGMFRYAGAMSSYVDLTEPSVLLALHLGSQREGIDIRDVWGDPVVNRDVWKAHNPASMVRSFRRTHVHLSSGDGSHGPADRGRTPDVLLASTVAEWALPKQISKFAAALRSEGVRTTTHLYRPGTHSWPYWQQELHAVWPDVTRILER
ncbi:alpha/beta hydrolase [Streptomyces sp. NPDC058735]|uniref:alpha/beta hydrolase n=1 Tax=unclassified Streptomyces TaxID=2593676 RepID=UPI0036A0A5AE